MARRAGTDQSHGEPRLPRLAAGETRHLAQGSWLWVHLTSNETESHGQTRSGRARFGRQQLRELRTTFPNPRNTDTASRPPSGLRGREITVKKAVAALRVWLMILQHLKNQQKKHRFAKGFKRHQVAWIPGRVSTQKVIIKQEICLS